MLIISLLPLLQRYSLGFDLTAGTGETVTLTIIPRKASVAKHSNPDAAEVRPISITGTAAEIDAELARGEAGALGRLIVARKALGDQIAEQLMAAEAAKAKAKPSPVTDARTGKAIGPAATPAPPPPPAPAATDEDTVKLF